MTEETTIEESSAEKEIEEKEVTVPEPEKIIIPAPEKTLSSNLEDDKGILLTKTQKDDLTDGDNCSIHKHDDLYSPICQITAGEAIDGSSTPQAVFIKNNDSTEERFVTSGAEALGTVAIHDDYQEGQKITNIGYNRISKVVLALQRIGDPDGYLNVYIYATDENGFPTGDPLASKSIDATTITDAPDYASYDFDFSPNATLTSETAVYDIIVTLPDGDTDNYIRWAEDTTNPYSGGQRIASGNGGTSWYMTGMFNHDHAFQVYGKWIGTTGRIYKSNALITDRAYFLGFITASIAEDSNGNVIISGIVSGFTGLTAGVKYYVQDTSGTIGTSAGTNTVLVGMAISTTELFSVPYL